MEHPQRIGRYRIERLLGVGSFATVWLGHDEVLDAHVAIKVLAENWSHDLRVRERFVEEARILWRLEDDHLVRVHAFDELPDGRPYAVLAWADGGSLRDRLEPGPLDVGQSLSLLAQIAAGVQVLHDAQIVHRDLTPGNVLFRSRQGDDERVLVADLGLAKELAAASGLTARAGTPGFMAPEQDHPLATVDRRADVYALGRIGVVLLTEPVDGPGAGSDDVRTLRGQDARWRLRTGVPAAVADVLHAATAHDPSVRHPDAAAFMKALADAGTPEGLDAPAASPHHSSPTRGRVEAPPTRTGPDRPPHRPVRARRWLAATAVGLALAGITVGTFWWLERDAAFATSDDDRIRVRLPEGWQATGSGWSGRTDDDGVSEPALIVSPDPARWAVDDTLPGAFIGLSPTLAAETTPEAYVTAQVHGQCDESDRTEVDADGVTWVVATFTGCSSGKAAIIEAAALVPSDDAMLYAQIAPPGSSDPTRFAESLLARIQAGEP